jgi:hypothetical protein
MSSTASRSWTVSYRTRVCRSVKKASRRWQTPFAHPLDGARIIAAKAISRADRSMKRAGDASADVETDAKPAKRIRNRRQRSDQIISLAHTQRSACHRPTSSASERPYAISIIFSFTVRSSAEGWSRRGGSDPGSGGHAARPHHRPHSSAARDLPRLCRWKTCRSECSVKMAGGQAPITGRLCAPTDTDRSGVGLDHHVRRVTILGQQTARGHQLVSQGTLEIFAVFVRRRPNS